MKSLRLLLAVAAGSLAQTAEVDTTILRAGNVGVYDYSYASAFNQTNDPHGYSGSRRFEITGLTRSGDSLAFRVAFHDSILRRSRVQGYYDSTVTVTDSATNFVFRQNAFTPYVPLFARGQAFTGLEPKVAYRGDTVKKAEQTVSPLSCLGTEWTNLEGIGRVLDHDFISCGNTHTHTWYQLRSFQGVPFDNGLVVGLRAQVPRGAKAAAPALFNRGTVTFEGPRGAHALDGRRVRSNTPFKEARP